MENTKIHISGSSLGIGFFHKKINKKSDVLKYFLWVMWKFVTISQKLVVEMERTGVTT